MTETSERAVTPLPGHAVWCDYPVDIRLCYGDESQTALGACNAEGCSQDADDACECHGEGCLDHMVKRHPDEFCKRCRGTIWLDSPNIAWGLCDGCHSADEADHQEAGR